VTASFTATVVVGLAPGGPITRSVPSTTGFVVLFAITAGVALVGLVLSFGLRNYRFHADGNRSEAPSSADSAPAPTAGDRTPSVATSRSS